MSKEIIASKRAPQAIGPYSQAVRCGDLLFTAGQVPINPETGRFSEGDIREQTRRVMENLRAVLEAAGCGFDDVVKSTVYLADLSLFGAFNEVYGSYFKAGSEPARSTIQVAALPLGALVEIDLVACAAARAAG